MRGSKRKYKEIRGNKRKKRNRGKRGIEEVRGNKRKKRKRGKRGNAKKYLAKFFAILEDFIEQNIYGLVLGLCLGPLSCALALGFCPGPLSWVLVVGLSL